MSETIELRIKRQDSPATESYWETFRLPYQKNMNVISCLMEIRMNPVTAEGKKSTGVCYDAGCLEEVCGSCSMLINGRPRQACSALVDELDGPIILEPFKKFPVVRDLMVDRSRMFEALKRVRAWVPIDGTHDLGSGPKMSAETQQDLYKFSECMTCGCCLEACPQVNDNSSFMGASAIGQAYRFDEHPGTNSLKDERMSALMGPGGVGDCGNAQNCVRVCPKEIPLTDAISEMARRLTVHSVKSFFSR
jgi:succinate dehydrogenase / fumarate reductase iron-sulfur subunit